MNLYFLEYDNGKNQIKIQFCSNISEFISTENKNFEFLGNYGYEFNMSDRVPNVAIFIVLADHFSLT